LVLHDATFNATTRIDIDSFDLFREYLQVS
jgi:hypothetical protein